MQYLYDTSYVNTKYSMIEFFQYCRQILSMNIERKKQHEQ